MERKTGRETLLFLCTGNYYRSRFAEEYFNHHAARRGLRWRAFSRGLAIGWPGNVGPVSTHCLEGLRQRGIPLPAPRSPQQLTEADLAAAGRIVALKEAEHRPRLEHRFPEWLGKVEFWQIDDVDDAPPTMALAALEGKLEELFSALSERAAA